MSKRVQATTKAARRGKIIDKHAKIIQKTSKPFMPNELAGALVDAAIDYGKEIFKDVIEDKPKKRR